MERIFSDSFYLGSFKGPNPHAFISVQLRSSGLGPTSLESLLSKQKDLELEIFELYNERVSLSKEIRSVKATICLTENVDESKNNPLRQIKREYPSCFDERSGNTAKQGLNQILGILTREYHSVSSEITKLETTCDDVDKKIEQKKLGASSADLNRMNSLLVILNRPSKFWVLFVQYIKTVMFYFSSVTIYFFLFMSFTIFTLELPFFIIDIIDYVKNIIQYEIILSFLLLL